MRGPPPGLRQMRVLGWMRAPLPILEPRAMVGLRPLLARLPVQQQGRRLPLARQPLAQQLGR